MQTLDYAERRLASLRQAAIARGHGTVGHPIGKATIGAERLAATERVGISSVYRGTTMGTAPRQRKPWTSARSGHGKATPWMRRGTEEYELHCAAIMAEGWRSVAHAEPVARPADMPKPADARPSCPSMGTVKDAERRWAFGQRARYAYQ